MGKQQYEKINETEELELIELHSEEDLSKLRFTFEQSEKRLKHSIEDIECIKSKSYSLVNFILAGLTFLLTMLSTKEHIPTHLLYPGLSLFFFLIMGLFLLVWNIRVGKYRPTGNDPINIYTPKCLKHSLSEIMGSEIIHYQNRLDKNSKIAAKTAMILNMAIYLQVIGILVTVGVFLYLWLHFPSISCIVGNGGAFPDFR